MLASCVRAVVSIRLTYPTRHTHTKPTSVPLAHYLKTRMIHREPTDLRGGSVPDQVPRDRN